MQLVPLSAEPECAGFQEVIAGLKTLGGSAHPSGAIPAAMPRMKGRGQVSDGYTVEITAYLLCRGRGCGYYGYTNSQACLDIVEITPVASPPPTTYPICVGRSLCNPLEGDDLKERLLELALEALTARKAAIDMEISAIRRELAAPESAPAPKRATVKKGPKKRSAASRKAQSEKMKAIWAARRAAQAKPVGKARKA